jgi:DNA-binding response OmpR family regulator
MGDLTKLECEFSWNIVTDLEPSTDVLLPMILHLPRSLLGQHEIAVLICERDLAPETWKDVMAHINTFPNAPSLIVASRLADDRLWAEALNLGAWDVLAKPLDRREVIRSVHSAWRRWHDAIHVRATAVTIMSAAS